MPSSPRISRRKAATIAVAAAILAVAPLTSASQALANQAEATLHIGGTGSALGAMKMLAKAFGEANPHVRVTVLPSLGSGGGIKALAAGKIDVVVSARPLKDKERAQGLELVEYASTPIIFASRHDNPAESLTLAQAEAAYSGEKTDWPDGTPVRLILRPATESDIDLMRGMSAKMDEAVTHALTRSELHVAINDQDNASALEKVPGSLGLTTLAQVMTENRRVKPLGLDGVEGTPEALQSGAYPHAKTLYVGVGTAPSAEATGFLQFVLSGDGRAILAATGHLPATAGRSGATVGQ